MTIKRIYKLLLLLLLPAVTIGQDRVLEQYLQTAEQNNPGVQAAYRVYQQSLERVPQMKALPDPSLSAGVFINSIETRVGAQKAKLSVSQMFPWFGTLDAKSQQAAHQAQATHEKYLAARNLLHYQVKENWYDLYLVQQKIYYTQKRVEILDLLERQSLSRFENNEGGMINVLYVQMLKEELVSKLELFRDKQKTLQTAFNLKLNRPANIEVELAESLPEVTKLITDPDSLWKNHSRLKALEAQVQASEYRQKAAKLSGLPQIGVGLDYAFVAERKDMVVKDNGKDAIMPMVTVKLPIFRKKYKAMVKESQLQQEQFQLMHQQESNKLQLELKKTMENYQTGLRDAQLYDDLLQKARQSLEILTATYEASIKSYEELMNMQQKIWIYEQKQVEAQVLLHKSKAYLEYLSAN
ncbi:MAG: TolC family protein [Marinifilaceae bacterium]